MYEQVTLQSIVQAFLPSSSIFFSSQRTRHESHPHPHPCSQLHSTFNTTHTPPTTQRLIDLLHTQLLTPKQSKDKDNKSLPYTTKHHLLTGLLLTYLLTYLRTVNQ